MCTAQQTHTHNASHRGGAITETPPSSENVAHTRTHPVTQAFIPCTQYDTTTQASARDEAMHCHNFVDGDKLYCQERVLSMISVTGPTLKNLMIGVPDARAACELLLEIGSTTLTDAQAAPKRSLWRA